MNKIAAKILNDKLVLKRRINNLHGLLDELSNKYGDYFDKNYLYKYGSSLVDTIGNSFSKEFSYRSIDNNILGNFYESTLFESDEIKNIKLIDEVLYEAFNLTKKEVSFIEEYCSIFTNNIVEKNDIILNSYIQLTGDIIEIDFSNKVIKAIFVEYDEEKLVEIDKEV